MVAWLATLPEGAASFLGSLAGAGLGLIAILAGALYNARLNRKRDDRLRRDDAASVARALSAELKMIGGVLRDNAKSFEDSPRIGGAEGVDMVHLIKVFPEVVSKLVLLQPETIAKTIGAYALIEQHGESLVMLGATPVRHAPSNRRRYFIPDNIGEHVAKLNDNLAYKLDETGRVLEEDAASLKP